MVYRDLEIKRFNMSVQDKMNKILYKMSRKYKNPAVFALNKDGDYLGIIMSCIGCRWDKDVVCVLYDVDSDFRDYYKDHDMIVIMHQSYNHKKNDIKIKVQTSYEYGLDKFMPVIYIEYELTGKDAEHLDVSLIDLVIGPNWEERKIKL